MLKKTLSKKLSEINQISRKQAEVLIKNTKVYNEISELVNYIYDVKGQPNHELLDITDGATHYHADYVRPSWAKTKTKTIEIEDHIFYRWEK